MLQDRGGVGADVLAVAGGAAGQPVEIAQGVGADLVREIGRIGMTPAGRLERVDFEQLPAVIRPR
jgi:hypothetical protein